MRIVYVALGEDKSSNDAITMLNGNRKRKRYPQASKFANATSRSTSPCRALQVCYYSAF